MWDIIGELVAGGTTLLLTTQYLDEADRLADRIAIVDGGRVVAEGTPDELKRRAAEVLDTDELPSLNDVYLQHTRRSLAA